MALCQVCPDTTNRQDKYGWRSRSVSLTRLRYYFGHHTTFSKGNNRGFIWVATISANTTRWLQGNIAYTSTIVRGISPNVVQCHPASTKAPCKYQGRQVVLGWIVELWACSLKGFRLCRQMINVCFLYIIVQASGTEKDKTIEGQNCVRLQLKPVDKKLW